jgi:uncharacterized peroxidase-related enzyme
MARIPVPDEFPGIQGLMTFRPETAAPLNELVEVLLRGPHSLTRPERQLIATLVLYRNGCRYAHMCHGAIAAAQLDGNEELVDQVRADYRSAPVSDKLKALLAIAEQVVEGGKSVTDEAVAEARAQGATDLEIHDTVLIAAAFCMYPRYIDGLDAPQPDDPDFYRDLGSRLADKGFLAVGKERMDRSRRRD